MRGIALLLVVFLLLQAGTASAIIDFNPMENSYMPGEYVNLGGIFTNNYTERKDIKIEQVLLHKDQDPMPGFSDHSVEPGRTAIIRGMGFTAQDITDSGTYTYTITVHEDGVPLESSRMSFEIMGSRKLFENIRVVVCDSQECNKFKSIFIPEKTAYIRVFDSEGAILTGFVEDDFGFRKDLDFEGGIAEFKMEKIGYFRVTVLAEKEGHESYQMGAKFYVIEGNYVLTEFFPMVKWLYEIMFAVVVVAVLITVIISLLKNKKRGGRLEEWLRWRRWRKKDEISY